MVGAGNHLIGAWGLSTFDFPPAQPTPLSGFPRRTAARLLVGQTEDASFGYNQYLTSDWSTQRNLNNKARAGF